MAGQGKEAALPHMIQTLAGPAAEAQADPRYAAKVGGDAGDYQDAFRIAVLALCAPRVSRQELEAGHGDVEEFSRRVDAELVARRGEIDALCRRADRDAKWFVDKNLAAIEAVAAALIARRSLTGDEVAALVGAVRMKDSAARRDAAPATRF